MCDGWDHCGDFSDEDPSTCFDLGIFPCNFPCHLLTCKFLGIRIGFCKIAAGTACSAMELRAGKSLDLHVSEKGNVFPPKIELLPWYIPPETSSTDIRTLGSIEFICDHGMHTVSLRYLCDGDSHCSDESPTACANRIRKSVDCSFSLLS